MAREWSERHIRELVRQEMKGMKIGPTGLIPAWIGINENTVTPVGIIEPYTPEALVPIDTIKINGKTPFKSYWSSTVDLIYPEDDGDEIRSFQYIIYNKQKGETAKYNGQNVMMAIPLADNSVEYAPGTVWYDTMNYIDSTTGRATKTVEQYPDSARYIDPTISNIRFPIYNMFAYQKGKIFGLEVCGWLPFRYEDVDQPVFRGTFYTLTDLQITIGNGWENVYSPKSEYDWDTNYHYIAFNLAYKDK